MQVTMPENELRPLVYTTDEVAKLLTVSRSTVYNLVQGGKLRRVKLGHRVLFPRAEIERVLREGLH